ncbi:DUF1877 family protein [Ferruginibacter profundus]
MSQSATLYRISQDTFKQLDKPDNKQKFDINSAKSYSIFQGSFMALEYILSKGQSNSTTELVNEIFNPTHSLGEHFFESLTPEEQFEFYESGLFIQYLDKSTISQLNVLIAKISSLEISSKYNAKELNNNGIYPRVWHNDNSPDQAYNERHILEDFEELKNIIKQADAEQDYIFVFVG